MCNPLLDALLARPVRHQQEGISLPTFSRTSGVSVFLLKKYCQDGRIIGARKHPITKQWWIYPPAKLLTGSQS